MDSSQLAPLIPVAKGVAIGFGIWYGVILLLTVVTFAVVLWFFVKMARGMK